MFTGIIEDKARVIGIQGYNEDYRITIEANLLDMTTIGNGESIAVNGVCLTALETKNRHQLVLDISAETLSCTTFSSLKKGQYVNIERALSLSSRLNGHLVSGHVDGTAVVQQITKHGRSVQYRISMASHQLMKYIAKKGSVCIDGVSLTVNDTHKDGFDVTIIPHTLENTIFPEYQIGTQINIEVDLMARYLERLIHLKNQ